MRVLLCNDDGIHAPGLIALHDALTARGTAPAIARSIGLPDLAPIGEVVVVAPLTVQSATGHGITFRQPLVTMAVDVNDRMKGVAVDGRPADCVKLALASLWQEQFGPGSRPDLVISGMNMGANVGINVLYSGTCAAALEAAFLGVPSIAVSLHHGTSRPRYDVAAVHARSVIDRVLAGEPGDGPHALRRHECVNINLPITEREGPAPGVVVCPMNTHGMVDAYDRRRNPLGETYYWSAGTPMEFHATEPGSDVQTILEGRIALTPLKYDLTDTGALSRWHGRLGG